MKSHVVFTIFLTFEWFLFWAIAALFPVTRPTSLNITIVTSSVLNAFSCWETCFKIFHCKRDIHVHWSFYNNVQCFLIQTSENGEFMQSFYRIHSTLSQEKTSTHKFITFIKTYQVSFLQSRYFWYRSVQHISAFLLAIHYCYFYCSCN